MDIKRLSRDYIKFPLNRQLKKKHKEKPTKEDLMYLYNELGWLKPQIAEYFQVTTAVVKQWVKTLHIKWKGFVDIPKEELYQLYIIENKTSIQIAKIYNKSSAYILSLLKKYNIQKNIIDIKKSKQNTYLEKTGYIHNSYNPETIQKRKNTWYNKNYIEKCIKKVNKTKETNLKRYNKEYILQVDSIKQKIINTNLQKYGVKYVSSSEDIKNKIKNTIQKKYGVDYYFQSKEFLQYIKQKYQKEYKVNSNQQIHYSEKTKNILFNKENFINYIKSFPYKINKTFLAYTLDISLLTITIYLKKYKCGNLLTKYVSMLELEINREFNNIFKKNNQIIKPFELDMYNEQYNLAIEANGLYWHSEKFKNCLYHQKKSLLCEQKGIQLIHIFEYEWWNERTKKILISMINSKLNKNIKIYARECQIKIISNQISNIFLEENHLQGKCNATICLGLYYNNELVSVMTFGKPRMNRKYQWELIRLCTKLNYTIVGGISKLFKYFIKQYKPNNIISYNDISKSSGNIYKILGFALDHISKPNYKWIKGKTILSRYQCQKLIKNDKSENDIMYENGFYKIFDAGNRVWVYK